MMNRRVRLLLPVFAIMLTGMSCTPNREVSTPPIRTSTSAEQAPAADTFLVKLETSKGNIVIEVHPDWAPKGADRIRELVDAGFYNECRFFRVMSGFMCQVGINGNPAVHNRWADRTIVDDPVIESNKPGYVTFAKTGAPNSRSTQFFINYGDNSRLDAMNFAPFGKVVEGMDVALAINAKFGERPDQEQIRMFGNEYLARSFPSLDYIIRASVVTPGDESDSAAGEMEVNKTTVETTEVSDSPVADE